MRAALLPFTRTKRPPIESRKASRRDQELFAAVIDGIRDGIFDWNLVDDTIYYSSYRTILGCEKEELGCTHDIWRSRMHPEDRPAAVEVTRKYANREIPNYYNAFRMRHKEGHWVWILSRGIGFWDENGNMIRLVGTHTDITAQKEREDELRHLMEKYECQKWEFEKAREKAEAASRAKDDFLAMMSHEIRTPLNVITGMAHLLMRMTSTPRKLNMIKTLHANADILANLVDDLLDLSRLEAMQIQLESRPFKLSDIFDTIFTTFKSQMAAKGLKFSMVNRVENYTLMGDPFRVRQILINLIGNALKFTEQGSVVVAADGTVWGENLDLHITVADTGVGITPEKASIIFDKFVQADQTIPRRFGGSGLGLTISRSLAQLMGGDIEVSSKPNEGSTFSLSLPVRFASPEIETAEEAPGPEMDPLPKEKLVLIVEDYPDNALVTSLMLEELGYAAECAGSATEALQIIETRKEPYDFVFMDVQMPGMDGFEATRRLRKLEKKKGFRHTIVGVTAHAFDADRERCLKAGMDAFISKPMNPDILKKTLAQAA